MCQFIICLRNSGISINRGYKMDASFWNFSNVLQMNIPAFAMCVIFASVSSSPISSEQDCSDGCYPELESNLFQGDILLPEGMDHRNALALKGHLWPNNQVPYVFNSSFKKKDKMLILNAMRVIESKTCILFTPKTLLDLTYIHINQNKGGCFAGIGYRPLPYVGALKMNLETPGCYHNGTIQHELLHVLGLLHEQARPDRDQYVDIYWKNVDKNHYSDFSKASESFVTTYNISYDYGSVMHYPKYAFSINGKDTIVAKNNTEIELGQRNGATDGDLEKIRRMYNC